MLALILVQGQAEADDPGMRFEDPALFPRPKAKFGGQAEAPQKKVKGQRLLETVGAKKQVAGRGGMQFREVQRLRQQSGIAGCREVRNRRPAIHPFFRAPEA